MFLIDDVLKLPPDQEMLIIGIPANKQFIEDCLTSDEQTRALISIFEDEAGKKIKKTLEDRRKYEANN